MLFKHTHIRSMHIDSKLMNSNWKRIVKSRSDDEIANVYIKQNSNKQIIGLVVTSVDNDEEAAFVNIVGTIDLAAIGKLGKQFNIPQFFCRYYFFHYS